MPTTSNFGWTTPADTDLVKDGAAAIRTLGNGIDTSLVDLKGGTTGQILSKASNTDLDYTWIANDQGDITEVQAGTGISVASGTGPIPVVTNTVATAFDAKGDLVAGTGADTFAKLTVGADNTVLTADSATATGLKWAAPSTGALTFITSYAFSNVATAIIDGCFTSTYNAYLIVLEQIGAGTANDDLQMQLRYSGPTTQTSAYYGASGGGSYASSTFQNIQNNNTSEFTIATNLASSTSQTAGGYMIISKVGVSGQPLWNGSFSDEASTVARAFGGNISGVTQTWTGILFKASGSNLYGTIRVYGLAKS